MLDIRYHNQLSQVFSNSFITKAISKDNRNELKYLFDKAGFQNKKTKTIQDLLSQLYKYLEVNYRTEYIYKNIIANKIHLLKHDLKKSTLLTEFRADNSKADVVIINGTTTVYEIKTELDSLDKLPSQLTSYHKLFDKIYVVFHKKFLQKIIELTDKSIGLILIDDELKINEIRSAKSNKNNLDSNTIFNSLRKDEYLAIIKKEYGYLPDVPNTLINKECKKLFLMMPIKKIHIAFASILKQRRISEYQAEFVKLAPESLKLLLLQKKFTDNQCEKIKLYLDSKL